MGFMQLNDVIRFVFQEDYSDCSVETKLEETGLETKRPVTRLLQSSLGVSGWEIEGTSGFEKCLEGLSDHTWRCLGWGGPGRKCSRRTLNFQG